MKNIEIADLKKLITMKFLPEEMENIEIAALKRLIILLQLLKFEIDVPLLMKNLVEKARK